MSEASSEAAQRVHCKLDPTKRLMFFDTLDRVARTNGKGWQTGA